MRRASSGFRRSISRKSTFGTSKTVVSSIAWASAGYPPSLARAERAGKRLDRPKEMNDLLFAGRVNAMNVDCAFLHNIETLGPRAFAKKVIAFREMFSG